MYSAVLATLSLLDIKRFVLISSEILEKSKTAIISFAIVGSLTDFLAKKLNGRSK
jgi:hypothetical protein